ncbi:protein 18A [Elephant endotheliotropic herpesvirus 6]|nr:protein 18A [Elephant endotheliotropic herpesvirus 6]
MFFSKTLLLKQPYLKQEVEEVLDKVASIVHGKTKAASCFQGVTLNQNTKNRAVDQDLKSTVLNSRSFSAYKLLCRIGHACEAGSDPSFILWETKGCLYGESSI